MNNTLLNDTEFFMKKKIKLFQYSSIGHFYEECVRQVAYLEVWPTYVFILPASDIISQHQNAEEM
jgi:hypothetical protein